MELNELNNMDKEMSNHWLYEATKLMDVVNHYAVTVEDMEILAKFITFTNIHHEDLEKFLMDNHIYKREEISNDRL